MPKFIIPTKVLIQNNLKYIVKYKIFISVLDDIIEKVLSSLFISEKNEEDGMNQERDMKPKKCNLFLNYFKIIFVQCLQCCFKVV